MKKNVHLGLVVQTQGLCDAASFVCICLLQLHVSNPGLNLDWQDWDQIKTTRFLMCHLKRMKTFGKCVSFM